VGQCCGLLERIYKALLLQYRLSKIKHADETRIMVKVNGQLYRLERFATKKQYTVERRTELRKSLSRRVPEKIKAMLIGPVRMVMTF
jgi:hypothetical protein